MTFDQWWATLETREQQRADKELTREAFAAGAASRDAEVQHLQFALADTEALEIAAGEKIDQLRAQINVLREALSSAESALDESRDYPVTYDEVITALITTPEQSLAAYRNKVIEECAKKAAQGEWKLTIPGKSIAIALRAMKEQP